MDFFSPWLEVWQLAAGNGHVDHIRPSASGHASPLCSDCSLPPSDHHHFPSTLLKDYLLLVPQVLSGKFFGQVMTFPNRLCCLSRCVSITQFIPLW